MTFALELVASGLIIQYWDSSISLSIFVGVFWVAIVALNFLPVYVFRFLSSLTASFHHESLT